MKRTLLFLLATSLSPSIAEPKKPVSKPEKPAAAKVTAPAKAAPIAAAAAAIKPEPICLVLEPSVMKTKVAQPLPGARQTVLSPATETKDGLKLLDEASFAATGLDWAAFQAKAVEAATRHLKTLKPEISRDKAGHATYALLHSERELHSSILLSPELGPLFEKEFGKDLLVLAPDRFSVYIFSRSTGEFQQFGKRLAELHQTSTFPASAEAFEWTAEGLKAIAVLETQADAKPTR
jgi:hypothetical protein